jgi:hypothetical protein
VLLQKLGDFSLPVWLTLAHRLNVPILLFEAEMFAKVCLQPFQASGHLRWPFPRRGTKGCLKLPKIYQERPMSPAQVVGE